MLLNMPEVPPRLDLIFQKYDPPVYFITFNTHRRKRSLANSKVLRRFIEFARAGEERGIAVGRFVIMPDHIHFFVSNNSDTDLSQWVRLLKDICQKRLRLRRHTGRKDSSIT
jgi:REP element-mobilizing transposase RayT